MEITNKRITGSFTDLSEGIKYLGSYQQDESGNLKQFNCSVGRVVSSQEGEIIEPLGDVYSFQRNNTVALNYNGFSASVIGQVAQHCEAMIAEIVANSEE